MRYEEDPTTRPRRGYGSHLGYSESVRLESDLIRELEPYVTAEQVTYEIDETGFVPMLKRLIKGGSYQPPTRTYDTWRTRLPESVAGQYCDSLVLGINNLVSGELGGKELSSFYVMARTLSGWSDKKHGSVRPGNSPLDILSRLASHLADAVAIRERSDPARIYVINGRPTEVQYSELRDASDKSDWIHDDLRSAKAIVDANYSELSELLGCSTDGTELREHLNKLVTGRLGNVRPLVWVDEVMGAPFSAF